MEQLTDCANIFQPPANLPTGKMSRAQFLWIFLSYVNSKLKQECRFHVNSPVAFLCVECVNKIAGQLSTQCVECNDISRWTECHPHKPFETRILQCCYWRFPVFHWEDQHLRTMSGSWVERDVYNNNTISSSAYTHLHAQFPVHQPLGRQNKEKALERSATADESLESIHHWAKTKNTFGWSQQAYMNSSTMYI